MAQLVRHFREKPRRCSYLVGETAALEYKLMLGVTPSEFEGFLQRGWRRFGLAYFRPACPNCAACVPLRIDVNNFQPSNSQKRALRRTRRFRIEVGRPRIDEARLALHLRWHHTREMARDWKPSPMTYPEYAAQFAFPTATGREMAWYDGHELVALGLFDVTPNAFSTAYFFYHPSIARFSPGIGNVMRCVEMARTQGRQYVHLGYRVQACMSLAYKAFFRPHELLQGRPATDEAPAWCRAAMRRSTPQT